MLEIKSDGSTGLVTLGSDAPEGVYVIQAFGDLAGTVKARPAGTEATPQSLPQYTAISNAADQWSAIESNFIPSGLDLFFDVTALPASGSAFLAFERITVHPLG